MNSTRSRAYLALIFVCLVWGSSFLGVKIGITQFGPFRFGMIRQLSAAAILFGWFWLQNDGFRPSRQHIFHQIIIGALTVGAWNGMVNWALLTVPTSTVAILAALIPGIIALLGQFWLKTERLSGRQWLGVAVGFVGLGLIFSDGWQDILHPDFRNGLLLTLACCFLWAFGTLLAKKWAPEKSSPLFDSGLQLLVTGVMMFSVSLVHDFSWPLEVDRTGWWAMFFVVIFGSVLAMTAYLFALKNLPATIASLYTYVNPIIALTLGVLFLNERISWPIALGMAVTLAGVFLISGNRKG